MPLRHGCTSLICSLFFYSYCNPRDLLSFLHDALPISHDDDVRLDRAAGQRRLRRGDEPLRERLRAAVVLDEPRSEEHTSELQSHSDLVCRLLLEKKK